MSLEVNRIINGDCTKVMEFFPENSIDCIVTDPPYGINFLGKSWDKALPPKEAFVKMYRVLKPGALAFVMSSPRQDVMWRMAQLLEESGFDLGQSFISWIYNSGFPQGYNISKGIDSKKGLKQEIVGKGKGTSLNHQNKINVEQEFRPNDYYKDKDGTFDITTPMSDEAKKYEGYYSITGLKPALEVIFMVQKPLSEKTIVDNVLKWGTGGININSCRIPFAPSDLPKDWKGASNTGETDYGKYDKGDKYTSGRNELGRFASNLLVSDNCLNKNENSTDSPSRYFDLDAWAKHRGFLIVPKADINEREKNINDETNVHPTVKPIKLMSYLIELGCPPDGIVLDPFVGSGTTCVAGKIMGRKYIGIELDEGYFILANKKIEESLSLDIKVKATINTKELKNFFN